MQTDRQTGKTDGKTDRHTQRNRKTGGTLRYLNILRVQTDRQLESWTDIKEKRTHIQATKQNRQAVKQTNMQTNKHANYKQTNEQNRRTSKNTEKLNRQKKKQMYRNTMDRQTEEAKMFMRRTNL